MSHNEKKKVLIVDDEPETTRTTADYLSKSGFDVLMAQDGTLGMKLSTVEKPDLILLDIMLPDFNGFEFLEEVKERGIETRIILMSAYCSEDEDIVKGIKAGACDFITKPLEPSKVLNRVKRVITLDNTINTQVSDSAPLIKKLVTNAERLKAETNVAYSKAHSTEKKTLVTRWIIRLFSIISAVSIVTILRIFGILGDSISVIGTAFVLPILLVIPIDRVYEFTAKTTGFQTKMKMVNEQNSEELFKEKYALRKLAHEYFLITCLVRNWLERIEQNPSEVSTIVKRVNGTMDKSQEYVKTIIGED
jgi:DNA-binding response OmpR family regulator